MDLELAGLNPSGVRDLEGMYLLAESLEKSTSEIATGLEMSRDASSANIHSEYKFIWG